MPQGIALFFVGDGAPADPPIGPSRDTPQGSAYTPGHAQAGHEPAGRTAQLPIGVTT
jgi:hypothetical protein